MQLLICITFVFFVFFCIFAIIWGLGYYLFTKKIQKNPISRLRTNRRRFSDMVGTGAEYSFIGFLIMALVTLTYYFCFG